eukprot:TRINITY_DN2903_c0_g1_i1.p3 TRINITY_DN2903_c0_g1~~TRINITY_DN2903_c0_g1_i1.p3  ORF type:complete len:107 (+),score=47.31 TRINITY_DN2903_c0_g1_i1:27-323(+)
MCIRDRFNFVQTWINTELIQMPIYVQTERKIIKSIKKQKIQLGRSCERRRNMSNCTDYELKKATKKTIAESNATHYTCLLYTSPSPRDLSTTRMPSSA